jgi:hypothetical protein
MFVMEQTFEEIESPCDYCGNSTFEEPRDAMISEFRIGSYDKHTLLTHKTCITDMLTRICREEITVPDRISSGGSGEPSRKPSRSSYPDPLVSALPGT